MPEVDIESLVDQMTLVGLISREQYREGRADAENGSAEALIRTFMRKGWITSWQLERLKKGDPCELLLRKLPGAFSSGGRHIRPGLSRSPQRQRLPGGDQGPAAIASRPFRRPCCGSTRKRKRA